MHKFIFRRASINDIDIVRDISERTFVETFLRDNILENINNYVIENFNYKKIKDELCNKYSMFYLVEYYNKVIAYMKLNLDGSQTERGFYKSLEVQRIYVLDNYKGMKIGRSLLNIAVDIAKQKKLEYI